jgi:hypothetical protein
VNSGGLGSGRGRTVIHEGHSVLRGLHFLSVAGSGQRALCAICVGPLSWGGRQGCSQWWPWRPPLTPFHRAGWDVGSRGSGVIPARSKITWGLCAVRTLWKMHALPCCPLNRCVSPQDLCLWEESRWTITQTCGHLSLSLGLAVSEGRWSGRAQRGIMR